MQPNVTVLCSPGCVILARSTPRFTRVSFAGVTDAAWLGATFLRSSESILGNIFDIGPDGSGNPSQRIMLRDFIIRGWQKDASTFIYGWRGGRGVAAQGDDIRIFNPTMQDPVEGTGTDVAAGGIRYTGGRRFLCLGGRIESGDDCLAFVPGPVGGGGNMTGGTSIEDALASNMLLIGKGSRCINFGLSAGDSQVGMWANDGDPAAVPPRAPVYSQSSSIRRSGVCDIRAYATGGRALTIRNDVSSGVIEDIFVARVALHTGPKTTDAVVIRNNAGGVRRILLDDLAVYTDPTTDSTTAASQSMVVVERVDQFVWRGGRADAPLTGAKPTVFLGGVVGGGLFDVFVGCGAGGGVVIDQDTPETYAGASGATNDFIGTTGRDGQDVLVERGVIENVPAGSIGLVFAKAINCGGRGVRFTPALTVTAGTLPFGCAFAYLQVGDPAPIGTITVTPGSTSAVPQPYVARLSSGANEVIGQGLFDSGTTAPIPDSDFLGRGLRFRVRRSGVGGPVTASFTLTVAAAGGTAASLGATASGCFLEGCDITTGVAPPTVVAGRGHRVADLFPFATAGNYTGGILQAANTWTTTQTFADATFTDLQTGVLGAAQSAATIGTIIGNANAINALTSYVIVSGTGPATSVNLDYIYRPANSAIGRSGDTVVIRNSSNTRSLVLRDGMGNLRLRADITLDKSDDTVTLIRGNNNDWYELADSNNA